MLTGTSTENMMTLQTAAVGEPQEPKNLPPWIIKVPVGMRSKMLYGVGFTYGIGAA